MGSERHIRDDHIRGEDGSCVYDPGRDGDASASMISTSFLAHSSRSIFPIFPFSLP